MKTIVSFRFMKVASFLFLMTFLMSVNNTYASNSPLCFTAKSGKVTVSFSIVNATHTIQYSTDSTNWSTYISGTEVTLDINQSVYFRAETNQTTATSFSETKSWGEHSRFRFTRLDRHSYVEGSGNIMSLYGPDCPDLLLQQRAFQNMFDSCTLLTKAPELPATKLGKNCYGSMFQWCTSLIEAPELPATVMAERCYYNMFYGCNALTTAPELPAMTLAEDCYGQMFAVCQSLKEAPALPATTLEDACYYNMFANCYSLVKAPELPATTMRRECYVNMFRNCQLLEKAPELPATTLAFMCYLNMFYGCTSLEKAPELPATTLAVRCYENMFGACYSLTSAPELPATVLKAGCYTYMFMNCISLTALPTLPVKTLAQDCCHGMFAYCSSLRINSEPPGIPWQIPGDATPATSWNNGMFMGTSGTQTFPPEIGVTYYVVDEKTSVEDIAVNDIVAYSNEGRIFVNGVAGETVMVYDANGHLVAETCGTNDTEEFLVKVSGVYFVRVGGKDTKKVIVK